MCVHACVCCMRECMCVFVNVYVCQSNLMKLSKPCVHVLVVVYVGGCA